MRIPVPTNRLVAFTLTGAVLTMVVAAGLAFPGVVGLASESPGEALGPDTDSAQQVAADAPEPNENFTAAVQTRSNHEDDEYEEHEDDEHEDDEHEDDEHEDDDTDTDTDDEHEDDDTNTDTDDEHEDDDTNTDTDDEHEDDDTDE